MPTLYVGIDVSKDKFDTCVKDEFGNIVMPARSYENNLDGMNKLVSDLRKIPAKPSMFLIGLEATGIYHRNLMFFLLERDLHVKEFNPLELSGLKNSRIRKTKTDKIDSEIIADGIKLYSMTNTSRCINGKDHSQMKEFGIIYHRLTENIILIKTRLRSNLSQLCPGYDNNFSNIMSKSSQQILKKAMKITNIFDISDDEMKAILKKNYLSLEKAESLTKSIKKSFDDSVCPEHLMEPLIWDVKFLLEQYETVLKQRDRVTVRIDKLMKMLNPKILTIPGIGNVTGCVILGCLGNIQRFKDGNSLTAYAGLDPSVYQSGKTVSKTGHITRRGNKYLRRYLDNASLVAIRYNPVIKDMYHRLRSKGKSHKVANIACARKLLMIVYSVEKNQKNFVVPSYLQKQ